MNSPQPISRVHLIRMQMSAVQNVFFPEARLREGWHRIHGLHGQVSYVCELYKKRMVPVTGWRRFFQKEMEDTYLFVRAVLVTAPTPERYEFTIMHSLGEDRDKQISWMLTV